MQKVSNAAALSHHANQIMSAMAGWQGHHLNVQAQKRKMLFGSFKTSWSVGVALIDNLLFF